MIRVVLVFAKDASSDENAISSAEEVIAPFLLKHRVRNQIMFDSSDWQNISWWGIEIRHAITVDSEGSVHDRLDGHARICEEVHRRLLQGSDYVVVGLVSGDVTVFNDMFLPFEIREEDSDYSEDHLEDQESSSSDSNATVLSDDITGPFPDNIRLSRDQVLFIAPAAGGRKKDAYIKEGTEEER
jgi:hypothetical protein